MLSLRRLMLLQQPLSSITKAAIFPSYLLPRRHEPDNLLPSNPHFQRLSLRFLDIYQMANKDALAKERARITDEMNRGYFADISEMKKHGGKVAMANKTLIPAMVAVKFPSLQVNFSNGRSVNLPVISEHYDANTASASLVCLSFRASSQAMIESWSGPFLDAFKVSQNVQLYEVSLIDSWFLSLAPVRRVLLWTMQKPNSDGTNPTFLRQTVYSFGDHYYFRKELKILNLLTGYVFLLDRFGRIRWQGFGLATPEEVSSLLSCTSLLLEEK